jgi:hypothetical protein
MFRGRPLPQRAGGLAAPLRAWFAVNRQGLRCLARPLPAIAHGAAAFVRRLTCRLLEPATVRGGREARMPRAPLCMKKTSVCSGRAGGPSAGCTRSAFACTVSIAFRAS